MNMEKGGFSFEMKNKREQTFLTNKNKVKWMKEMGKVIFKEASNWLLENDYKRLITIEDFSYYFMERNSNDEIYEIIAGGGELGNIVDKIAHCLHEIIEVSEILANFSHPISFSEIGWNSKIRKEAHEKAKRWETKFLKEVDRKQIERKFKRFKWILKEEMRREKEIDKEIEEMIRIGIDKFILCKEKKNEKGKEEINLTKK